MTTYRLMNLARHCVPVGRDRCRNGPQGVDVEAIVPGEDESIVVGGAELPMGSQVNDGRPFDGETITQGFDGKGFIEQGAAVGTVN